MNVQAFVSSAVVSALDEQKASLEQVRQEQALSDRRYELSRRAAAPLLLHLQSLRRLSMYRLNVSQSRLGEAVLISTNIYLECSKGSHRLKVPLYFALDGNTLYSNLRKPEVRQEDILKADMFPAAGAATTRVNGISTRQLFELIYGMAVEQNLVFPTTAQSSFQSAQAAQDDVVFRQSVAQAKPLLAGLRHLRQLSDKRLSFTLTRSYNALCVHTNLLVDRPYDERGSVATNVGFVVEPDKPVLAQEFLRDIANLTVAQGWIKPRTP